MSGADRPRAGAGATSDGPSSGGTWSLWREDDNRNRFRMQTGLSERLARDAAAFTARGHKQRYWAEPDSA